MNRGDHDDWDALSGDQYLATGTRQPLVVANPGRVSTQVRYDVDDSEPSLNLLKYWDMLLKHRWLIAGVVAGMLALGLVWTLLTTPIYRATTVVQIEREAAKVVNVEGVEPEGAGDREFYQTQYALLQSRSLAERVVDRLNLTQNQEFMNQRGSSPVGSLRRMLRGSPNKAQQAADRTAQRRKAVGILTSSLTVAPVPASHLVAIHYESPNPRLAAQVSVAVAENFIGANLDRRFEASSYARRFLEERLAQVKARLEQSEQQLVAYAANQNILDIQTTTSDGQQSSQSLPASNLLAMNAALSAASGERIRAEQRWRQAQSSGASVTEVLESPTIQALRQQRANLQVQYQEKLSIFKPEHPTMVQLKSQMTELDKQIASEVSTVKGGIRSQYEIAARQEAQLRQQVAGLTSGVLDLRNRSIQYNILQREVDTNRTLYDGLLQRYKEIGVAGGVGTNNVSIVDKAQTPGRPYKPNLLMNLLTAAGLGLLLGIAAAFVLETLDETIKVPEDIEGKIGIPLLGAIPVLEKGITPEEALADARSPFSEAYYSVRTALQFSTTDGVPRNLLITSARPSEGKSTSALALAHNFAKLGMKVLLVDADLRNPSLHRAMRSDNGAGLANYLTGRMPLVDLVQVTDQPNLGFMPCGPLPPNPAELLAGGRIRDLMSDAAETFDLLIIDGPPVLGLADAPLLASVVKGTVLVVEAGTTRQRVVKAALRRLDVGRAHVLGALLSKFSVRAAGYGYGYGYNYAYSYDYGVKNLESKT
jgi:succinoglycan biosynthesis transport protein ExoP